MELTLLAVSSVFLVGVGYAFVQKAQQSPLVVWSLICVSLFVLSTRDLFRSRECDRLGSASADAAPDGRTVPDRPPATRRPPARADGGEDPSR